MRFAIPNDEAAPAAPPKLLQVSPVALLVSSQLWQPVLEARFRQPRIRALRIAVLMPEAAMDEDDFPPGGEHEIRSARKCGRMQPVPVPHRMNEPAHLHFGRGVL